MVRVPQRLGANVPFAELERTAHGLRLRGTQLHLDPRGRSELGFIAHARGARATLPARIVATAATVEVLKAAQPRALLRSSPLPAAFGKPFALGALKLTLYAAGHLRGSAQVRCETGAGASILYSGDLGGAGAHACATAEPREQTRCETLILRASLGHPIYVLPPRAEVLASLSGFVRRALAAKRVPVVLAAPLGGAQEVARHLGDEGHVLRLHPTVLRYTEVYQELGVALRGVSPLSGAPASGEVVVLPYDDRGRRALAALPSHRTCLLTARAVAADLPARSGADEALPLSDHAGFDQLIDFAERSGASRVLTLHGHGEDLAQALRKRGIAARALDHEKQLELF
jgi:putative mRNA 3-end processing factor